GRLYACPALVDLRPGRNSGCMARDAVAAGSDRDRRCRDVGAAPALSTPTLCDRVVDILLGIIARHGGVADGALVKRVGWVVSQIPVHRCSACDEQARTPRRSCAMSSLTIIESILRDRQAFFGEIRQGQDLKAKIQAMFISSIAFL